jgi:D-alanyl-D-alanine dipeptidase
MQQGPPTRPWHQIPIEDCGEALIALPPALLRCTPHPYASLGAPYGPQQSPFALRQGVVERLLQAQSILQTLQPELRLAIFDGWRPVAVQQFMVLHTIHQRCQQQGVDPVIPSLALTRITLEVGRFWAPPSTNPATPPPHSTGAAVDLTLADASGFPLPMGGEIDTIGPVSEPDHYAQKAATDPDDEEARWHRHRQLLAKAMSLAGFARHPNEWWHFSVGDQLWAWISQAPVARYGRVDS